MNRFQSLVLCALAMILRVLTTRQDAVALADEMENAAKWTDHELESVQSWAAKEGVSF